MLPCVRAPSQAAPPWCAEGAALLTHAGHGPSRAAGRSEGTGQDGSGPVARSSRRSPSAGAVVPRPAPLWTTSFRRSRVVQTIARTFSACVPCANRPRRAVRATWVGGVRTMPCKVCGGELKPRNHQYKGSVPTYCSRSCSMKGAVAAPRKPREPKLPPPRPAPTPITQRACTDCGNLFRPDNQRTIYCSSRCSDRSRNRRHVQLRRAWDRAHGHCGGHRKKARRVGVQYEPVDRLKVFARDGWKCQLCGATTPRRLMGSTHPRAPELDHIIPMNTQTRGSHTYANVHLACRACNGAKGARPLGQLRLT